MADVFDSVYGQPKVREFLRSTIQEGRVSHAYLFTGQAGSNKTIAAYAFAQAIICPDNGCGSCDDCKRAKRRKHPDIHYVAPEGADGYLVQQIREVVADSALAPIRAARKVYIIDRVDRLGVHAANAFLKTLEEPPDDVVMILLGRTRDSVLPTIVSRCQVVPFRQIPAKEAVGIVVQNTGTTPDKAAAAVQACGGSISRATEFIRSPERMAYRKRVLEILGLLASADDLDIMGYARELIKMADAPLDGVRKELRQEMEANAEYLASGALRRVEQRNKNVVNRKARQYLRQTTDIIRSWLRDVLMIVSNSPSLVINTDAMETLHATATNTKAPCVCRALRAVDETDEALTYNVSPETCLDVLLLDIREALYGTCCIS
ncbi:MAG: DNA polymerase III subunit delta' [Eggerthellaceae bacterium]|jgi:DNA polymerase-3 subunit delta'